MIQVRMFAMLLTLTGTLSTQSFAEADLTGAPPPFQLDGKKVVPIDIERVDVDYDFSISKGIAYATATIQFQTNDAGWPMFDLVPAVKSVQLNDETLPLGSVTTTNDPHKATKIRVLKSEVSPGLIHTLRLTYQLRADDVTFNKGKVRVGFFTSDLAIGGRQFIEQYAPGNFEFDHIRYQFQVKVSDTTVEHEIFSNGDVIASQKNQWNIVFPDYFTSSSVFFHLVEKNRFYVSRFDYAGVEATIPVIVYSSSSSSTQSGASISRRVLRELEEDYGAFAHKQLVIYVTPSGGGMEHCGAAMTTLGALAHEITHSWFARGVMPASGNAGWVDEAVASWRDGKYPRINKKPNRNPVNLGGFSPYRRHTTMDAYTLGKQFLGELDSMFANKGGMKLALRELFAEKKHQVITVEDFKKHLEDFSSLSMTNLFSRYVYGKNVNAFMEKVIQPGLDEPIFSKEEPVHKSYSKEELRLYR